MISNSLERGATSFEGFSPFPDRADSKKAILQRLFLTFANGWPGKRLMLPWLAVSTFLVYDAFARLQQPTDFTGAIPQLAAAAAGVLLLVGLWTPAAGMLVALLQIWIAVSEIGDFRARLLAAAHGVGTFAGKARAWSVDAPVFRRKWIFIRGR